jgi:glycosyltransferase involved in cell wall biosynthesis
MDVRDGCQPDVVDLPGRARTERAGPSGPDSFGLAMARYRPISDSLAIAPRVSVLIPAKNEASNLPHVFDSLPSWVDQIVLVDGRSVDGTAEVARRLRPDIEIVRQQGQGKGDALRAGFAACTGDIIVTIDADGSTDGGEMVKFVGALVAGADFAKGSRFTSGGGSDDLTLSRRWGNRFLMTLVNWAFGTRYTDLCYGYNAFWSRHLPTLALKCSGFEIETLMNVRAAKTGLKVQEIPSHEHPRMHGVSNLRAVGDGWRILKLIIRERYLGSADTPYPVVRLEKPRAYPVSAVVGSAAADSQQEIAG